VAAASDQASNILDYLLTILTPVKALAPDDVQGYMRDSEIRQSFTMVNRLSLKTCCCRYIVESMRSWRTLSYGHIPSA